MLIGGTKSVPHTVGEICCLVVTDSVLHTVGETQHMVKQLYDIKVVGHRRSLCLEQLVEDHPLY